MWLCAALCDGVARQTGHEMQFCSQLVVAQHKDRAAMQGPSVLRCPTETGEEGERGRRGSLTGRPLRNAINSSAALEGGRMADWPGRAGWTGRRADWEGRISKRSKAHGTTPPPAKPTPARLAQP